MWSRAILNQFNLPNEDLLCVAARARVREQVRHPCLGEIVRERERSCYCTPSSHARDTYSGSSNVSNLENLILELSHGVIGSIPRHSVFVKVNFNDFRVGHVERIRFPTQRFERILVLEAMLLRIDEGEHAVRSTRGTA